MGVKFVCNECNIEKCECCCCCRDNNCCDAHEENLAMQVAKFPIQAVFSVSKSIYDKGGDLIAKITFKETRY